MKITESAANAIVNVMKSKGLNPEQIFLEIGLFNGGLGMGFTRERAGRLFQFGELNVIVAQNVDSTGVVVDFGEINGRRGLIFLGEEHVNHNDKKGDF